MTKRKLSAQCPACSAEFPRLHSHQVYCSAECAVWSRVDRSDWSKCWPWQGSRNDRGYGQVNFLKKRHYVHRLAYELTLGCSIGDREVCHRCDNPPCCNPTHMFLGTHADNMADMHAKGRRTYDTMASGERAGGAKLSEAQVLEIRRKHSEGAAIRALARNYGMSQGAIQSIIRRDTWRHI